MELGIDIESFGDKLIQEGCRTLETVGHKRGLGVKRWDLVLSLYPHSGTVTIPVKVCTKIMDTPFYFVVEKVRNNEFIFIKPIPKGDPYSLGDVFGFFGFSTFQGFRPGMPVIIVEGIADWAVVKQYYPYVLVARSANLSPKQLFFISNITRKLYLGFDLDRAGSIAREKVDHRLKKCGIEAKSLIPPEKDWGKAYEDDFLNELLEERMKEFVEKITHG